MSLKLVIARFICSLILDLLVCAAAVTKMQSLFVSSHHQAHCSKDAKATQIQTMLPATIKFKQAHCEQQHMLIVNACNAF